MSKATSFRFSDETKEMLVQICEHDRRSQVGELEHLISQRYSEILKEENKTQKAEDR